MTGNRRESQKSGSDKKKPRRDFPSASSARDTPLPRGRRKSQSSRYPCEICGELYSRIDNMRVHQRMHSGEKPYKCKYCGQPFRWAGALRSHEASHVRSQSTNLRNSASSSGVKTEHGTGHSDKSRSGKRVSGSGSYSGSHEKQRKERNESHPHYHRSHQTGSAVIVSEVDPGVRDFELQPWHKVLDD